MGLRWIIGLVLFAYFLLTTVLLVAYCRPLHSIFGGNTELHQDVLEYFDYKTELPANFTQREVSHLNDVRVLLFQIRLSWFLAGILVAIFCMLTKKRAEILEGLTIAGRILIGFSVLGVVGVLIFTPLFNAFHGIFFKSGSWVFPAQSTIIQLFPFAYFFWAYVVILVALAIEGGFLCWLRRRIG